jgi:hypothetical protein
LTSCFVVYRCWRRMLNRRRRRSTH